MIAAAEAAATRPPEPLDAVLVTHGLQGLDDYYTEVLPALASAAVVPPVLGAWIVGEGCAGLGIREDRGRITRDLSRFKPHYIEG